jgi:predicted nucleic acid-binding protein
MWRCWSRLAARLRGLLIIASIAEANECVLVTHNEKDFADIHVVNPLREIE